MNNGADRINNLHIVNSRENPENELLLASLRNCSPFVVPALVEKHIGGTIESLSKEKIDNLNDELHKLAVARVILDSENVRLDSTGKKYNEQIEEMSRIVEDVNSIAGYDLAINPELIINFNNATYNLKYNITKTGFASTVKNRLLREADELSEKNGLYGNEKHVHSKLPSLIKKIKSVNESFSLDNTLPFVDELRDTLNLNSH